METVVIVVISVVAAVAVLHPIVKRRGRGNDSAVGDRIDAEVARYRRALQAGAVCPECLEANPPDSRYCGECGTALVETEAQDESQPGRAEPG